MKKTIFALSTTAVFSTGAATLAHAAEQHTVKPGETLYSIAEQYHMDINELKSLNSLNSEQLQVNQILNVSQPAAAESEGTYTVQAGDTLYSIAKLYQIEEAELQQLNGLKGHEIISGQKLKVSGKAAEGKALVIQRPLPNAEAHTKAAQPALPAPVKQASASGTYKVQSGDSLSAIAKAYKMSVAQLQELNGLGDFTIYAGQTLKVSGQPASTVNSPAASVKTPAASGTYAVKSGDSLSAIAKAYKMSVAQLQELNGLNSHLIYAGQTLNVSGTPAAAMPVPDKPSVPVSTPATSGTYTVKSGDSLSVIAKNYKMSIAELKQLNSLTSDTIFVGQKLKVSGEPSTVTPAPSKPSTPVTTPAASDMYTVKSGDSLSVIAKNHNMDIAGLKQLNSLTSDTIFAGQKLKVSGGPSTVTPAPSKPSTSVTTPAASGMYTVKSGDSLSLIAIVHNMSVAELKRLNSLTSDTIFAGQKLKVINGGTNGSEISTSTPVTSIPSFSIEGLIAESKKHLGIPYVWGGSKPSGFDCSGFIHYVFNKAGKSIPRTNTEGYYSRSYEVDQPKAGDLVFFVNTYKKGISHMGIYLGGNQFIQASSSQGITITSLDNSYFKQRFDSFKRFY
ncbi:LysM peptidoglycan-binding domain-containing protein [Bacillus aerolatus]|uniref:LysM peptidoglycan-binding domain-containing protein n=1 Tax=Bacillus aerolatus TaxID=2653354 RepID=A0A6I1FJA9_9BACI|nr:peptidoglycan endopeptidase [Bacillus aerolatus]KAB7706608.1 LysM peptidoglycan-binding domain-containing protein [Bacillus aerolatus]